MTSLPATVGWTFWMRWLAATTLAWIVGIIGAIALSYLVVNVVYPKETNVIVGLCIGAAVGYSQIVAVRPWFTLSRGWAWGTVVSMGPAFVASVLVDEVWPGMSSLSETWLVGSIAVASVVIGGWLQARALRPLTQRANRWVLANLVAWGLVGLSGEGIGILVGGVILGAASGGLLIWIFRAPEAPEAFGNATPGPVEPGETHA